MRSHLAPRHIIAVDWGKQPGKRSAYLAQIDSLRIARLPFEGQLSDLLRLATELAPPVLIGIDAAIGFPLAAWQRLIQHCARVPKSFVDLLLSEELPAEFFTPVATPQEWLPQRPFVRPPRGRWKLNAFIQTSAGGFYRKVDLRLNGNPIFITSGLPGSVGSGTRALWQEMIAAAKCFEFQVWPFHGRLDALYRGRLPVIAEIYPKACYGIALADALPAPLTALAKVKPETRRLALQQLRSAEWARRASVDFLDLDSALASEDDFDALMSAAALLRLVIEDHPLERDARRGARIEGGVLGEAGIASES